jgi:hypothetical protein
MQQSSVLWTWWRVAVWPAIFIALCKPLIAQNVWQGDDPVNSASWGDADNWSLGSLPTAVQDVVVGLPSPTVVDVFSAQTGTLEITPAGQINILSNRTLVVQTGELTNEGVITVNSSNGSPAATLSMPNGGTIDGAGEIVLAAAGSLANIGGGGTTTHATDHTIRGEGWISLALVNNGTITAEDANGDSTATLTLLNGAKTNNGVIQSSATSTLTLSVLITQGPTGRIIADGGTVHLGNAGITGGKLESANGGVFDTIGNSLPLNQVHLTGQVDMVSGSGVVPTINILGGGITNDGTIVVQSNPPTAGGGTINFGANGQLFGSGQVILNYQNNALIQTSAGVLGINGADHTIRGVGTISASLSNLGTIIAEPRNGGTILTFNDSTKFKSNDGIIRADAGAVVRLTSVTIVQNGGSGKLLANEGTIELGNAPLNVASLSGGFLESVGAGTVEVTGNARLDDVAFDGVLNVQPTRTLTVGGATLINNGIITLKNSMSALGGAQLILRNDGELTGTGEVVLTPDLPSRTNAVSVVSGGVGTNAAGHTIRGEGFINAAGNTGTLINDGTLEGTSAAANFEVLAGTLGGGGLLKNVQINGAATHAPGTAIATASVPLEGAYTITNNGKLNLQIGSTTPGSGYDQLISTDPTNVITIATGGTQLNVSFINSFIPSNGDVFTLLDTAGTITGNFGTINLPGLSEGIWENLSDTNTIAYRFIAPLAADFDVDGDVDDDDLVLWQVGYSIGSEAIKSDGDADEDGDVDGRDYLYWQRQYTGPGNLVASVAVPEPASLVLALSGFMAIRSRKLREHS